MKFATLVLFTLITHSVFAQSYDTRNAETGFAMGVSGGYSSKQCVVANLSAGAMLLDQNHVSVNMVILGSVKNPDIPSIFEGRIGHIFNTLEVFGGAAYHIAGSDGKISSNINTGIRPAYGVIKHFYNSSFTLSAQMSGKIFSFQVGIFGVR